MDDAVLVEGDEGLEDLLREGEAGVEREVSARREAILQGSRRGVLEDDVGTPLASPKS